MKVNWSAHLLRVGYLFIGVCVLAMVWTRLKWPWAGVVRWLPLPFLAYAYLAFRFIKRERLRKDELREEIRRLGDDLAMEDDLTVDNLHWLYQVEELERILGLLKAMPVGQRRLQSAIDAVEQQPG
jgi:hypothetical protein